MMKHDFSEYTIEETIRLLGRQYGELRRRKGLLQKDVSARSGLSVFTITSFESGSGTGLTMASYIKLLRAIGCGEIIGHLSVGDKDNKVKK